MIANERHSSEAGAFALKREYGAAAGANSRSGSICNAMTVDVEDYFQVQAFAGCIPRSAWNEMTSRVEANTERILTLFSERGTKATFFVLGWVAERHRHLIRRIVAEGHELASHGFAHIPVHEQAPDTFRSDVARTKALLEDTGGVPVKGYRAASFSIDQRTPWAFDVLAEAGYEYSSSVFPIVHDFYGMPDAPRFLFRPGSGRITEIPMTTFSLWGRNLPCGGGGYFRLLPYRASRWALRRVNSRDRQPSIFYFHPWEIDPEQPRVARAAPLKSRIRHYLNLSKTEARLRRLLTDFKWGRMDQVFLGGGEAIGTM